MKKVLAFLLVASLLFAAPFVSADQIRVKAIGQAANQQVVDGAQSGDTLIFAGEYSGDAPFVIKDKCKITVEAKGATFVNRKCAAFSIRNAEVAFKNGSFEECEYGIEASSSTVKVEKSRFEKNLIGIVAQNSTVKIDGNYFRINYRASVVLVGDQNILLVGKSNKFEDNYSDICPAEEGVEDILTRALGNRIQFYSK